ILQRANDLESRAIANVRKTRVLVTAEVTLKNPSVGSSVENRAPRFQFAHAVRCLARMQLGHAPVVEILPAAHGIGKVNLPVVSLVGVGECGCNATLRHYGVSLSQQRFTDE